MTSSQLIDHYKCEAVALKHIEKCEKDNTVDDMLVDVDEFCGEKIFAIFDNSSTAKSTKAEGEREEEPSNWE
eukprot:5292985-Amphidinium_carterae.1